MNQLSSLTAEKIPTEPTVTEIVAAGDQQTGALAGRGSNGRFTTGCTPGPERPRKPQKRSYVEDGWLYIWCMEFEKARGTWVSLVERMGPVTARKYLAEIEAENGQIKFRGLALEAIAAAEAAVEIKPASEKRARRRPSPKRKQNVRYRANRKTGVDRKQGRDVSERSGNFQLLSSTLAPALAQREREQGWLTPVFATQALYEPHSTPGRVFPTSKWNST